MKICPACSREYSSESALCDVDGVALVALQAGEETRPEQLIGQIVDGRYRVERLIGRGGMGYVYAVRHVVVGKPAAMKVLRLGAERSEGVLQRFIREAQTAGAVRSRHITETLDFGQLPNGFFYVVMELLEGMTLTTALKEGLLTRESCLHVFIQMAEALSLVHEQGIVHRDLKPDNVFLVNEGGDPLFVKLLDFGIAKVTHAEASGLTETGVILGTPYYMSPEQARGERLDHRTDIYALGVMMYRAFTGKLPFVAESMIGVLTRHLTEAPEPPSMSAQIDVRTEQVILRCMEKSADRRFQSMSDVAAALRMIAASPAAASQAAFAEAQRPPASPLGSTVVMDPASHALRARPGASYQGASPPSGSYSAAVPSSPSGSYSAAVPSSPSGAYAMSPASSPSGAFSAAPMSSPMSAQGGALPVGPASSPSGAFAASSAVTSAPSGSFRGVATSDSASIKLAQRSRIGVALGVPIGALLALLVAGIGFYAGRRDPAAAASSSAPQTDAAPVEAKTAPPAASEAPSAAPVASASASASSSAAPSAEPVAAKPTAGRNAAPYRPAPSTQTSSAPRGKRPEIRSPFE